MKRLMVLLALVVSFGVLAVACSGGNPTAPPSSAQPTAKPAGPLTVYSGRSEELVEPIIEQFQKDTGIEVKVRYGDTAELAATISEEGSRSPADVFWAQDAGALGAVAKQGLFQTLPSDLLNRVDARFRSANGEWVGITGRVRVVAYNTKKLTEADLPASIYGFTDAKWKGRIGWSPTNGSFQAFVTAMRLLDGEAKARQWLEGIKANQPKAYANNEAVALAVGNGEVDVGFVNHYYLYALLKSQGPSFPLRNYYPREGGVGALVNAAGIGILKSSQHQAAARAFIDYMLSRKAQEYFGGDSPDDAYEYPLVQGIQIHPDLPPLSQIKSPKVDLSNLDDLQGTLKLLQDLGIL